MAPKPSNVVAHVRSSVSPMRVLACSSVPGSAMPDRKTFDSMVVHHAARPGAVAGLELRQVLPNRDQLDPVAGRRRRQDVELGQRRDIGRLVEHHEQRAGRAVSPSARHAAVGGLDDLGHHRREHGRSRRWSWAGAQR